MKLVSIEDLKALIKKSKDINSSNHPFLDQRWLSGEGRNHCYRRPYYRFCQLLAKELQPDLVVELGIDEGDCCAHFASGNQSTKVIGVDIHKDGEPPSIRCRQVEATFSNFKYLRNWTWDALLQIEAPIDILFIDSWHEHDYCVRDWNDYSKLLRKGSIVLIDDLHMVGSVFNLLPYEKFVDHSMNPTNPFGVLVYNGKETMLPYKPMPFMPEFK